LEKGKRGVGGNGEMAVVNEATWEKVRLLFPSDQHNAVARILETECGNNLGATLVSRLIAALTTSAVFSYEA
jgi:hypothetical protein